MNKSWTVGHKEIKGEQNDIIDYRPSSHNERGKTLTTARGFRFATDSILDQEQGTSDHKAIKYIKILIYFIRLSLWINF